MLNLYEILEVSNKASKEVIDKAYHVLAKKYHPDLQPTEEKKKQAEVQMKKINEAYDILGNEQKRKLYDLKLEKEIEEQKRIEKQNQLDDLAKYSNINQNRRENFYTNNQKQNMSYNYTPNGGFSAYKQLYNNYWNSKKQNEKQIWTWKRVLDLLKALAIIIIIIIVLWLFPPTNKLIVGIYEQNPVVKTVGDILGTIIGGIVNGIITFLKNLLTFNIL